MKRYGVKEINVNDALRQKAAQAFIPHAVDFVYVFGSAVQGHLHEESDIDVGVYFTPALASADRFKQMLALIGTLARLFNVPEEAIDITILNDADTLLRYVAMSEGKVLYERDHQARVEFELSVMRQRDDEHHYRRLSRRIFLARLAQGTI